MTQPLSAPTRAMTVAAPAPPETPAVTSPPLIEDGRFAPRPTRRTIALRTFVPWQVVRFAVINLRMLAVIAKSHD